MSVLDVFVSDSTHKQRQGP